MKNLKSTNLLVILSFMLLMSFSLFGGQHVNQQTQNVNINAISTSFPVAPQQLNGSSNMNLDSKKGANHTDMNKLKNAISTGTSATNHAHTQLPTTGEDKGTNEEDPGEGEGGISTKAQEIVDLFNKTLSNDYDDIANQALVLKTRDPQETYNEYEQDYFDLMDSEDALNADNTLRSEVMAEVPTWATSEIPELNQFLTKLAEEIASAAADGGTTDGGTTDGGTTDGGTTDGGTTDGGTTDGGTTDGGTTDGGTTDGADTDADAGGTTDGGTDAVLEHTTDGGTTDGGTTDGGTTDGAETVDGGADGKSDDGGTDGKSDDGGTTDGK
ncbi:hypothetical protein N9N67_08870 [Bacteriovoracaceae bacterium]|nr:hypothetical protein [Bacteriovoracaceae bacterium]